VGCEVSTGVRVVPSSCCVQRATTSAVCGRLAKKGLLLISSAEFITYARSKCR